MRAVIYCRVSQDDSGHHRSVTEQEAECRQQCDREGWDVGEVIVDNDIGASRHSRGTRTGFARLREVLTPGDVLVTWEASRAGRNLADYVELRELCADRGVPWFYSGRLHDMDDGDGRFMTGLDALVAEKASEETRDRVLRSKRALAAAGKPSGKLAYGYRIVRDEHTGRPLERIPDPATAPIVREIVARVIAGEALSAIARDLSARAVPPVRPRPANDQRAPWTIHTVRALAQNPTYAGLRVHRGEVVGEAAWEPLVSRGEHAQAVAILAEPGRRMHRGTEPKYLLTGIGFCECGSRLRVMNPGRGKGRLGYICSGNLSFATGRRNCASRRMDRVDPYVIESVIRRLEGQELIDDLAGHDDEYAAALTEIAALRERLDGFTDAAAAGELSPSALARVEQRLLPQIAAAEATARGLVRSPLVAGLMGPGARQRWKALSIAEQRDVVRALVEVVLHPVGKIGRRELAPGEGVELRWVG